MRATASFFVADPREPDGDACLNVSFVIHYFGSDPAGYAEHFDPGSGPEIELTAARDDAGVDVLPTLNDDQAWSTERTIRQRFDFREEARAQRDAGRLERAEL